MTPPSLKDAALSASLTSLVSRAEDLYRGKFASDAGAVHVVAAPGRVNLIGEHTDYTGGFVLPLAIECSTVVYGTGSIESVEDGSGASMAFASCSKPESAPADVFIDLSSSPKDTPDWTSYVAGTVFQYLPDLPASKRLNLKFSIAGDVPLGSGLSSSASLEVAVARFVESILGEELAFSSEQDSDVDRPKVRAMRCQRAENTWCNSPCGIMDQFVSSAASEGALLLIDCRSLEYTPTKMAASDQMPVIVVCNSKVSHDIAGGEYPVRVEQCKTGTAAIAKVNDSVKQLRDATLSDIDEAKDAMDPLIYRRCKHVIMENDRTLRAKDALIAGDWTLVGKLMNESHASMRDDYEVSCEEIDILVELAQSYNGVYGSRLTGGGFGGCTVTLVQKEHAEGLVEHLKSEYTTKTGKDCDCFVTTPATGARVLAIDSIE